MDLVRLRPDFLTIIGVKHQSADKVASATGLDRKTVMKIERSEDVKPDTVALYAKHYGFELADVIDHPFLRPLLPKILLNFEVVKWEPVETAANGLQWRLCELVDRQLPTSPAPQVQRPRRKSRGKQYDLSEFARDRDVWIQKVTLLQRHADVCARIHERGGHPNIALNYLSFPDEKDGCLWWILDEWIEGGETLEVHFKKGPLKQDELARCMKAVADGLKALHAVGIVRRELTPQFVLKSPTRVVLTDFELVKLTDGSPSVRQDGGDRWKHPIYVAPEAKGPSLNWDKDELERRRYWDLYSWAIMLAHASFGREPRDITEAREMIGRAKFSSRLSRFALRCLNSQDERSEKDRPPDVFPDNLGELLTEA